METSQLFIIMIVPLTNYSVINHVNSKQNFTKSLISMNALIFSI